MSCLVLALLGKLEENVTFTEPLMTKESQVGEITLTVLTVSVANNSETSNQSSFFMSGKFSTGSKKE